MDGYNVIFAWEELKGVAAKNLDVARRMLCDLMSDYQGFRKCELTVVFDAYQVKGGTERAEQYHNIRVVYTKEAETADAYIERATYQLGREDRRVRVVSSDNAEQSIILGHGALRVSAAAFREELLQARGEIQELVQKNNLAGKARPMREALTRALPRSRQSALGGIPRRPLRTCLCRVIITAAAQALTGFSRHCFDKIGHTATRGDAL